MSKEIIMSLAVMGLLCTALRGQEVKSEQVVRTSASSNHMFVDLEVPAGELMIKSSGNCGISVARLQAPDSSIVPKVTTKPADHGNHSRKVQLESKKSSLLSQQTSNLRMQEKLVSIESYTSKDQLVTEYHHDPSLSTDLNMHLGMGTAKMDLSDLTLQNLSIRSAFTDVFVTYRLPNQAEMKKMDIHATRANVVLENVEKAKAEFVSVQNDMGETRLSLGDGSMYKSTIYLQSGVGNCTLVISEKQPVMIVLKRGLFSKLDNQGNFEKLQNEKEVYVNQAYAPKPSKGNQDYL